MPPCPADDTKIIPPPHPDLGGRGGGGHYATPANQKKCVEKTLNKKSRPAKQIKNNKTKGTSTPVISYPDNLIGKFVLHLTDKELEDEELVSVKVIVVKIVGGPKGNPKFLLKHVDSDEVYFSNHFEDYQNKEVKLFEINSDVFIGSTIGSTIFLQIKIQGLTTCGELRWWILVKTIVIKITQTSL